MDNNIVYEIDCRGCNFMYHWFFYVLAGLRYIEKEDEKVNVYMPWLSDYNPKFSFWYESITYFKDKFNIITNSSELEGKTIIKHFGEPLIDFDRIAVDGYKYIVDKFKSIQNSMIKGKYTYISRKNIINHNTHHILNEDDLIPILKKYNFNIVYLEDYNFEEKIKLFQESEIIMSPFGSSLTLLPFCSNQHKIIELVHPNMPHNMYHYKVICELFNIPYYRFTSVSFTDSNSNIIIKLDELENLLVTIL